MKRKTKKDIGLGIKIVVLAFVSFFTLLPLIWMITTSFEPDSGIESYSLVPKQFTLKNYPDAWNYPKLFDDRTTLGTMFMNSIFISSVVTLTSILFDSMAGYALARKKFFGRNILFWGALVTLMIPLYLIILKMGLMNTRTSLILPFMASGFGVFMFRQAFMAIPLELEEAAKIDGARDFFIYSKIMLPLVKPTIATMTIFKVIWSWNMFFWPLIVIQDYSKMPINLGLAIFRGHNVTRWGLMTSAMIIATIPIIVVFLSLQKWYIRGLTAGAVKG